jgi:methyl-accepting chemotaxis protein
LLPVLVLLVSATFASAAERFDSYLYKRPDGSSISKMRGSLGDITSLSKRYGNEFIWVKQGDRQYVVKDAAVLAEVRTAFKKLHEIEEPVRVIEKRLQPHTDELERLSEQLEDLTDRFEDGDLSEATRASFQRKMHVIEKEMSAVEKRMESVERELERVTEVVEKEADRAEDRFEDLVARAIDGGKAVRVK